MPLLNELSDFEDNGEDQYGKPDYYIDKAPEAVYVPDPDGHDKATHIDDY